MLSFSPLLSLPVPESKEVERGLEAGKEVNEVGLVAELGVTRGVEDLASVFDVAVNDRGGVSFPFTFR